VTLTANRDEVALRAGVERWLGRPAGEIARPAPGWSCETVVVDRELVIRLPPVGDGIFPSYDLAGQAAVQRAVAAAGVPVPAPVTYVPDPSFFGAPFVAMPFVAGAIPSEFTPADPWLLSLRDDRARQVVWQSFVETVVDIHAASIDGLDLRAGLAAELAFWEEYLGWATDGSPPEVLAGALDWCRRNQPGEPAPNGLLWGDVRLGNVVFDVDTWRPKAVLDWDMTSVGPIEMDLGWYLALDRIPSDLTGMSVAGFGSHDAAVALVEARLGRPLVDLEWYEIFALVRASAVSTRIGILFERAGQQTMFNTGEDPTLAAALDRMARR
jgi:aminoglycoside phosphotransferase (APT) family kinase protein